MGWPPPLALPDPGGLTSAELGCRGVQGNEVLPVPPKSGSDGKLGNKIVALVLPPILRGESAAADPPHLRR